MLARLGRIFGVLLPVALLAQPLPAIAATSAGANWRDVVRAVASAD